MVDYKGRRRVECALPKRHWHSHRRESKAQLSKQEVEFCREQLETQSWMVTLVCPGKVRVRALPGKTRV